MLTNKVAPHTTKKTAQSHTSRIPRLFMKTYQLAFSSFPITAFSNPMAPGHGQAARNRDPDASQGPANGTPPATPKTPTKPRPQKRPRQETPKASTNSPPQSPSPPGRTTRDQSKERESGETAPRSQTDQELQRCVEEAFQGRATSMQEAGAAISDLIQTVEQKMSDWERRGLHETTPAIPKFKTNFRNLVRSNQHWIQELGATQESQQHPPQQETPAPALAPTPGPDPNRRQRSPSDFSSASQKTTQPDGPAPMR